MKATGIVRRIDNLGRIVIPKEIRRTFRIREGESLEIFVDGDNIVLRKHSPMETLKDFAGKYVESIYPMVKQNIMITDRDTIIAIAGANKDKYLNKYISQYLEDALLRRDTFMERHKKEVEFSPGLIENVAFSLSPIIVNGDAVGLVIIFTENNDLSFIDNKTTEIAAQFLSKNIEN
ncbi:MAG: stage V sporulation T C-terminal domain-containing protein [Bacilli bacterium]